MVGRTYASRLTLGLVLVAVAGCDRCGDQEEGPVVPTTVLEGSGFAPQRGGTDDDAEPERPRIVHDELPTPADFAVAPVEGDWTTFRGAADRSGLRDVRAIHDPRIRWSVQVGIQGYADTPIVTGDAVYVASQGELHQRSDDRDGVYAIDPANGAIRWHLHTSNDANGLSLSGDTLVVGTDDRVVIGIDRRNGTEQWRVTQDCQIYHAPVVRDGTAYLIRKDELGYAAIDVATGSVTGALDCVRSERGALSADDERIYRAGARESAAFDDAGRAWTDDVVLGELRGRARWAPPLLTASMVITAVHGWPFGAPGAVDLRPAAVARWKDNGQVAWVIDIDDPDHANPEPPVRDTAFLRSLPWISGDRLFWTPTNVGELVAFDATTGERLESVAFPDCRNRAFGSIVGTRSVGYYARHDGVLYGFSTSPLRIVWSLGLGLHGAVGGDGTHFPVQGPCNSEPKDGSALFATPAIADDGTLYVGSGDGWLYAIADSGW